MRIFLILGLLSFPAMAQTHYVMFGPATVVPPYSAGNHILSSNMSGANVVTIQQLDCSGYSVARYVDYLGEEHSALGYGNDCAGGIFRRSAFWESLNPVYGEDQYQQAYIASTTLGGIQGPGAHGFRRIWFAPDGTMHFYDLTQGITTAGQGEVERIVINGTGVKITGSLVVSPTGSAQVVPGSLQFLAMANEDGCVTLSQSARGTWFLCNRAATSIPADLTLTSDVAGAVAIGNVNGYGLTINRDLTVSVPSLKQVSGLHSVCADDVSGKLVPCP